MAFETILVERERDGMLVLVTFNRPKQLNAINRAVVRELDELCAASRETRRRASSCSRGRGARLRRGRRYRRVRGAHARRGADVRAAHPAAVQPDRGAPSGHDRRRQRLRPRRRMRAHPVLRPRPGRGDRPLRPAGGQPRRDAGRGGTQRLTRVVGMHRAKELNLLGEMIDAQEAYRLGIANRVVPADRLMAEARAMADKLIAKAPITLRLIKEAMNEGYDLDLPRASPSRPRPGASCTRPRTRRRASRRSSRSGSPCSRAGKRSVPGRGPTARPTDGRGREPC